MWLLIIVCVRVCVCVCVPYSNTKLSQTFQFPFTFYEITHVLIMKFIHRFQQNILETEEKLKIMRDNS